MAENTQLFRINAPNLTDATADTWATLFDKINNNFEKIASLPFLQGVKGDSFQLSVKHIWEKNYANKKWYLTEEGALLLNAIFNSSAFNSGETFETSYSHTNNYPLGNPLNSFNNVDKTKTQPLQNNDLYFYVIIDDSGIELEKKLGQIFYFVDGRLNNLKNGISSGIADFTDYSGCFNYNLDKNTFEKLNIIPTLYYDSKTQEICWQFSGTRTGIPAVGAKGEDGTDSKFKIVKVKNVEKNCGEINGVLKETNPTKLQNDIWDTNLDSVKAGYACICFKKDSNWQIAYGYIYETTTAKYAYWTDELIISSELDDTRINNYFARLGTPPSNQTGFRGIQIPSCPDRTNKSYYNTAHVIKTANYNNSARTTANDLIFRLTNNAFGSSTPTREKTTIPSIILDNYTLKVQPVHYWSTGIDEIDRTKPSSILGYGELNLYGDNNKSINLSTTNAEFDTDKQVVFYNGISLGNDTNDDNTTYSGIIFGDRTVPAAVCRYNGNTNVLNFILKQNISENNNIRNSIHLAVSTPNELEQIENIKNNNNNNNNEPTTGIKIETNTVTAKSDFYANKKIYQAETLASGDKTQITASVGLPVGSIIMWYGGVSTDTSNKSILLPNGSFSNSWAVCNGASINNNNKFKSLQAVIGNTLPDFSGKYPLGINKESSSSAIGGTFITEVFYNNQEILKPSKLRFASSNERAIKTSTSTNTTTMNGLNVYFLIKYN